MFATSGVVRGITETFEYWTKSPVVDRMLEEAGKIIRAIGMLVMWLVRTAITAVFPIALIA